MFVTDPQYRNGFSHTLAYVVGEEPHCYQHSRRQVSLQLRKGGDCYAVTVESSDATLACDGDLSRSCCGHLPMGEVVQVSGKLSIGAYTESWWPKVEMTDICVE